MESSALAEDGIYKERHIMDSLRVHGKNGRINSDERLIELLNELSIISWDLVNPETLNPKSYDKKSLKNQTQINDSENPKTLKP